MPKISLNGRLLEPDFAFPCAAGKSPHQESAAVKMASLGFKTTRISAQDFDFWKGEGQYDFSNLDWQARRLIKLVPDARLEMFLILNKMREWCKAHPDDVVGYQTGPADPRRMTTIRSAWSVRPPHPRPFAKRRPASSPRLALSFAPSLGASA